MTSARKSCENVDFNYYYSINSTLLAAISRTRQTGGEGKDNGKTKMRNSALPPAATAVRVSNAMIPSGAVDASANLCSTAAWVTNYARVCLCMDTQKRHHLSAARYGCCFCPSTAHEDVIDLRQTTARLPSQEHLTQQQQSFNYYPTWRWWRKLMVSIQHNSPFAATWVQSSSTLSRSAATVATPREQRILSVRFATDNDSYHDRVCGSFVCGRKMTPTE